MFGRQPNIMDNIRTCLPQDLHTQLLRERLDSIYNHAIEQQSLSKESSQDRMLTNQRTRRYKIGDLVVMRDPNKRKGKLDMRFTGPFQVIEEVSDDVYRLEKISDGKRLVRHTASLKPYFSKSEDQAPSDRIRPARNENSSNLRGQQSVKAVKSKPTQESPASPLATSRPITRSPQVNNKQGANSQILVVLSLFLIAAATTDASFQR